MDLTMAGVLRREENGALNRTTSTFPIPGQASNGRKIGLDLEMCLYTRSIFTPN